MYSLLRSLYHWQDMLGAIIGGLLGVIGALIVSHGLLRRELRTASRMLQRDLLNVVGMVYALTGHRKVPIAAKEGAELADELVFYRHLLSPLFEEQMAIVIGESRPVAGLLIGFHQTYSAFEFHMRKIDRIKRDGGALGGNREVAALPRTLDMADWYAQACLYLVTLLEMGIARRWREALRRQLRPTDEDRRLQKAVKQLLSAEEQVH